jgi:nicotinamidase-related amidase
MKMGFSGLLHNRFAERLEPHRAVLVLVDCQTRLIENLSADPAALRNNLLGLGRVAQAHGVPAILSLVGPEEDGEIMPELVHLFGPETILERRSGACLEDRRVAERLRGLGRRELVMAGLVRDTGIMGPALSARYDGYDVHVVYDACGTNSSITPRVGVAHMVAAGIKLTNWVAVMAELSATGGSIGPRASNALRRNLEDYRTRSATLDVPDLDFAGGTPTRVL